MSGFLRALAPRVPEPLDVETMEQENWPWLDFIFASMTRVGQSRGAGGDIYDVLRTRPPFLACSRPWRAA